MRLFVANPALLRDLSGLRVDSAFEIAFIGAFQEKLCMRLVFVAWLLGVLLLPAQEAPSESALGAQPSREASAGTASRSTRFALAPRHLDAQNFPATFRHGPCSGHER